MKYDARYFGELFVNVAKKETSRVSYHYRKENRFEIGVRGSGNIPYDTGRLQNSIYLASVFGDKCQVKINGEETPYAVYLQYSENIGRSNYPNMHRGFLQAFTKGEFVAALRRKFKGVEIK